MDTFKEAVVAADAELRAAYWHAYWTVLARAPQGSTPGKIKATVNADPSLAPLREALYAAIRAQVAAARARAADEAHS